MPERHQDTMLPNTGSANPVVRVYVMGPIYRDQHPTVGTDQRRAARFVMGTTDPPAVPKQQLQSYDC